MDYYTYNFIGYGLMFLGVIITLVAQFYVDSKYRKYKKVVNKKDLSGQEVARKILDENGLKDVYVVETKGFLSDHYDPRRKVVRLSTEVFHGTTISSASVAAHECGHAVQDKEGYFFIRLRGWIFPAVNFASKFGYFAVIIGFIFNFMDLAWAGIGLLLVILFFNLITLPVEFNASARAKVFLKQYKLLDSSEIKGTNEMLNAAAATYVASLATTILEVLRLVLVISSRDD